MKLPVLGNLKLSMAVAYGASAPRLHLMQLTSALLRQLWLLNRNGESRVETSQYRAYDLARGDCPC